MTSRGTIGSRIPPRLPRSAFLLSTDRHTELPEAWRLESLDLLTSTALLRPIKGKAFYGIQSPPQSLCFAKRSSRGRGQSEAVGALVGLSLPRCLPVYRQVNRQRGEITTSWDLHPAEKMLGIPKAVCTIFEILAIVKIFILNYNERMNLEKKIARGLTQKKKTLSVAESCTGGLITHQLTNIPGSSQFFKFGCIVYSNEAKIKFLRVRPDLLRKHGAVSAVVAEAMAKNVRQLLKTNVGISVTGTAGPAGATENKPVGLTYIAISTKNATTSFKHLFKGNRLNIKAQAARAALELLLRYLRSL